MALSKPAPGLRNVYSVLRVSPDRFPRVRGEAARQLETFLVEETTQQRIAAFGRERFGQTLFQPLRLGTRVEAPAP